MEINLTENSHIYSRALALANKELRKAVKLLKDNEDKWNNYLDLKLHEAAYTNIDFEGYYGAKITFDNEAQSDWFYMFCEDSYNMFIEDLQNEYNIDFDELRDNVGRTSSFYLGNLHSSELLDTLANASETYMYGGLNIAIIDNLISIDVKNSVDYFEDLEDFANALLDFAYCIYDEVEESLEPIITVYDYITSFKNNQVEYFKEYVENTFRVNF